MTSGDNKTLRIGFDGKRAMANATGIGNYSRLVIDAMSRLNSADELAVYSATEPCFDSARRLLERPNVALKGAARRPLLPSLWRSWGLTGSLLADGLDVYHGLSNELPFSIRRFRGAKIVTIHDLIFRRIPEDFAPADRLICDTKFRFAAKAADRIIAISESTRRDLVSDYGIDPAKIDVVLQGCDPIFHVPATEEAKAAVRRRYGLPEEFCVTVSTVRPRKNQLLAVKALAGLPRELRLVVIGNDRSRYAADIRRYAAREGLEDRVMWLGGVDFADLPAIYSLARFSSYTSRYEGFGLPVVESLACSTPVIAARGSSLEEAGGAGAFYVDPDDPDDFVEKARRLLDDAALAREMAERGRCHALSMTDRSLVEGIRASYFKALTQL